MTKAEIIAELRRSAAEDGNCAMEMKQDAWDVVHSFWRTGDRLSNEGDAQYRMFVLLVAHALEDE